MYDDEGRFWPLVELKPDAPIFKAWRKWQMNDDYAFIPCTPMELPTHLQVPAAERAIAINPVNRPRVGKILSVIQGFLGAHNEPSLTPAHLAVMTDKKWPSTGVELTVSFPFEQVPLELQQRIVAHGNAWNQFANVKARLVTGAAQVRITLRGRDYWSYLGTDILSIPMNQPTMTLGGFSMNTPESEFRRVGRHEWGHTWGFPHEHLRKDLVDLLDPAKTIPVFQQLTGWSPAQIRQQVLTPISEASIRGTPNADQDSILCYQIPGSCTFSGQPIRGGTDIDILDGIFAGTLYPLAVAPPPPPPPPPPVGTVINIKKWDGAFGKQPGVYSTDFTPTVAAAGTKVKRKRKPRHGR